MNTFQAPYEPIQLDMKKQAAMILADSYVANIRELNRMVITIPTVNDPSERERYSVEADARAEDSARILSALGRVREDLGEEVWTELLWKNKNLILLDGDISRVQALEKMLEAGCPLPNEEDGTFQFGREIE